MTDKNSISNYLKILINGILMGTANKVPGVSGGLVAIAIGFYEELIFSLKRFDKTENDEFIYKMEDVAERVRDRIPYNEVHFMGSWTTEPSFVMMTTILKMSRLGFLPSIDRKEI